MDLPALGGAPAAVGVAIRIVVQRLRVAGRGGVLRFSGLVPAEKARGVGLAGEARIEAHCARRRSNSGCCSINSSTAARNGDSGADRFRWMNSTNSLTDSCSSGVSERIASARFPMTMDAFHPQYIPPIGPRAGVETSLDT